MTQNTIFLEAADAIEELIARDVVPMDFHERCLQLEIKKRIELEKQLPQWISVEERLPKVDQSVLFCAFGRTVGEGTYRGYDGFHHVWKMYAVAGTYWDDEVTHWMPLPAPPKGVE